MNTRLEINHYKSKKVKSVLKYYLVPHHDIVPVGPELVEGEDVEPGALISGRI